MRTRPHFRVLTDKVFNVDIVQNLAQYASLSDILRLGATCRYFNATVKETHIGRHALYVHSLVPSWLSSHLVDYPAAFFVASLMATTTVATPLYAIAGGAAGALGVALAGTVTVGSLSSLKQYYEGTPLLQIRFVNNYIWSAIFSGVSIPPAFISGAVAAIYYANDPLTATIGVLTASTSLGVSFFTKNKISKNREIINNNKEIFSLPDSNHSMDRLRRK